MSESKRNRIVDTLLCVNRKTLILFCKRYKIRGYSKIRKCDLVKLLAHYQSNPAQFPLAGRKTRSASLILADSNQSNNRARERVVGRRGRMARRRTHVIYDESDESSDMDAPIKRRGVSSQSTQPYSPISQ